MTHHPTFDGRLFVCPACMWRAVLTSDGRIIQTQPGAIGHDHIGQAQVLRNAELAERLAFVARTMTHLRQQYVAGALDLTRLRLLMRCVATEYEV